MLDSVESESGWSVMKKATKNRIEFAAFWVFLKTFGILPYAWKRRILEHIFIFGGTVLGVRKKIALENLHRVYPDMTTQEEKKMLREIFRHLGLSTAEMYFTRPETLYSSIKTHGLENLEAARSMDKGIILTSGHIGNWEIAGHYLSQTMSISVIYKGMRNNLLGEYTNNLRTKGTIKLIRMKQALRYVLKYLKEKYVVCILMDQNAGKRGVLIDFLGSPASAFVGAAKFAIKTGAPVVPAYSIREPDGSFTLYFEPMLDPTEFTNSTEDVHAFTQKISSNLEDYIRRYPEQWFWVHRRWRGAAKAKPVPSKSFTN